MNKLLYTEDFFLISKSINDIKNELLQNSSSEIECKFENNQYIIYSKISYGTLQLNGIATNPISTVLNFAEKSNDSTEIKMKSKLRYEYLFITSAFLFISIVSIFKFLEPKLLLLPIIYIITFLWFRMIYQKQEKELHLKIKKKLSNL